MSLRNNRYFTLWQNSDDRELILLDDVKNLRHLVTALDPALADAALDYFAIHDRSSGHAKQFTINDLVTLLSTLGVGGGVIQYNTGDVTITASDTGVTASRDAVNGIVTITVPEDVHLFGANVYGVQTDTDSSNNLKIKVVYTNETVVNQNTRTADIPQVEFVDLTIPYASNGGVVSETYPGVYAKTSAKDVSLVTAELDGSDAVLQVKVESIVETNFLIKLTF